MPFRRMIVFALIGAVVASFLPVVGPIFGLIVGGALGYFLPIDDSGTATDIWPKIVIGLGVLLGAYALFMDTTVPTLIGRVNNIGLMNDRQNYLIVAGVLIIAGIGMMVLNQRKSYEVEHRDAFDQAAGERQASDAAYMDERKRYAVSLGIERQSGRYVWGDHRFANYEDAIEFVEASREV